MSTPEDPTKPPNDVPGEAKPESLFSRMAAPLFAVAILGVTVYALVAVLLDLAPASWVIEREARFSFDGRYGMVEAWAVTWFHLLLVLFAPLGVGVFLFDGPARQRSPELDPRALARHRAVVRSRLPIGVLLTAATVLFYVCLVFAPEWIEPIGIVGRFGLVLGPMGVIGGPSMILDALLAPAVKTLKVARIDPVDHEPTLRLLNSIHRVDARVAESLHVGSEVSLIVTPVLGSVLSVTTLDPYR